MFQPRLPTALFFGSTIHFQVKIQSRIVHGWPSAHLSPGRILTVYVSPSCEMPPFCRVGTSASSPGSGSSFSLTRSIGSKIGY